MEIIEPRIRSVGEGHVRRVLPVARRRMVGPVIFLDIIGPERLGPGQIIDVPEHPHIGLSTLTYLLDGRLVHRDSTGANQIIEPGAVNWMTSGSGVTHTERTPDDDVDRDVLMRGVQIWVALPVESEDGEPFFSHTGVDELPVDRRTGVTIRLVAGAAWGLESPVPVSSPMVLADVALDGSASLAIDSLHAERGVVSLEGEIVVDGQPIVSGSMAVLDPGTEPSVTGWGRILLVGGEPVGERHIAWNFVHSTKASIERAQARWDAGEFPRTSH